MKLLKKLEDYKKPLTKLKNEHCFLKLTGKNPNKKKIAGTYKSLQ